VIASRALWQSLRHTMLRVTVFPMEAAVETLRFRLNPYQPPSRVDPNHGGGFLEIGREFRSYFIDLGGLRPDHSVLDVGSGCGRMAVPLFDYLTTGTYDGIEIMKRSVTWCRRAITSRHPNFRFHHGDVFNREYNPWGRAQAEDYRFPFEDSAFDFVLLTSVLTHLLPPAVENYLREIARVLKPGGTCFATWFLLDAEARELCRTNKEPLDFAYNFGLYRSIDRNIPERAVAFDQDHVLAVYQRNSLIPKMPLYYGSWSGRERPVSFQDIIVATKEQNI
jgi:SAM-dependent methyltransferase